MWTLVTRNAFDHRQNNLPTFNKRNNIKNAPTSLFSSPQAISNIILSRIIRYQGSWKTLTAIRTRPFILAETSHHKFHSYSRSILAIGHITVYPR